MSGLAKVGRSRFRKDGENPEDSGAILADLQRAVAGLRVRTGSPQLRLDVREETLDRCLLHFLRHPGAARPADDREWKRFAGAVAANVLRNRIRSQSRQRRALGVAGQRESGGGSGADETLIEQERGQAVRSALWGLGEEDQWILLRSEVEGLSVPQIARLRKESGQPLSLRAVESRLRRARGRLRDRLDGLSWRWDEWRDGAASSAES